MQIKTAFTILSFIIVAGLCSIYFFIPSTIIVSRHEKIKGFDINVFALLKDSLFIQHSHNSTGPVSSNNKDFNFYLNKNIFPRLFIGAETSKDKINGEVEIVPTSKIDSTDINWHFELPAGYTPFSRLKTYFTAKNLKANFIIHLEKLFQLSGDTKTLYGLTINESIVRDTLIATLIRYETKPPFETSICKMMFSLRKLVNSAGVLITDSAMMIRPEEDSGNYKLMVGVPVNKNPVDNRIVIKKMIPGKLLTGMVTGGTDAISTGYVQIKKYINDRNIEVAALPYEIPLTNRCAEKDTSKWITKICYPIF
jgi:effector-binding domain-containing protein